MDQSVIRGSTCNKAGLGIIDFQVVVWHIGTKHTTEATATEPWPLCLVPVITLQMNCPYQPLSIHTTAFHIAWKWSYVGAILLDN